MKPFSEGETGSLGNKQDSGLSLLQAYDFPLRSSPGSPCHVVLDLTWQSRSLLERGTCGFDGSTNALMSESSINLITWLMAKKTLNFLGLHV